MRKAGLIHGGRGLEGAQLEQALRHILMATPEYVSIDGVPQGRARWHESMRTGATAEAAR